MVDSIKSRVSILWQWQFIAVVLPLLAVAFFAFLAAFYIRASYVDQPVDGTRDGVAPTVDPVLDPVIESIKALLEGDAVAKLCRGEEASPLGASLLLEQLKMNQTILDRVREAVEANPQLGISVDEDSWSAPNAKTPLWCTIKSYLWNTLVTVLFIVCGETTLILASSNQ